MTFHTKSQLRNAGLVFSFIFFTLFFLIPYLLHQEFRSLVILFSVIIFSLSYISPYTLRKPYDLWIKLGNFLGKINSLIILTLFFYVLITPVAIVRRLFNKVFKNKKIKTYYSDSIVNFKDFNFRDQF
ncbi:hypothetical protein HA152_07525 [Prochlorococcus marinus XMU1412]|uniref:SxtJ family membrane protein n=1 Tax=Prochlorococcus marinus TaxID=1219 RepID=UPI001ADB455B|nr:SxtJ family membrane protein [Prochlorococcus marinus]MBO8240552.1 hypothetical protein [Prochlorococcus marinus XMU1412]MBW3071787.1 hypothetical protein [Prochlorococcus marinus str. MU1412]